MRNKLFVAAILTVTWAISACGARNRGQSPSPGGQIAANEPASESQPLEPGSTGFKAADGVDYVDGGDPRVAEALAKAPQSKSEPPNKEPLSQRLKDFQILRFSKGSSSPDPLGTDHVVIRVNFKNGDKIKFKGAFAQEGQRLNFEAEARGFRFKGGLEDTAAEIQGDFTLSEAASGDSARLFYRSYKGKVNVRPNDAEPLVQGSKLDQKVQFFKSPDVHARVQNWVVLNGPSLYRVDLTKNEKPVVSFRGESKRTGSAEHTSTVILPKIRQSRVDNKLLESAPNDGTQIRLIGNAEQESRRLFAVEVKDRPDQPAGEFLIDVDMESPPPARAPPPEEVPAENPPEKAPLAEHAYLRLDIETPRAARMAQDFEKNRDLPGVKKFIAQFQKKLRRDLENFYFHANPFRPLIEAVARAFDVSPAFAYLTVVESTYFTGGRYRIEAAGTSSALGPFQLLSGTAREVGLRVTGGQDDERRFFTPSACGAAKYVGKLADMFSPADSTISILAYYQGDGGAAAAIHCAFGGNESPSACASRINNGFSSQDYARFKRLAKSYHFSYAEMDRLATIPGHMRNYVNKKLAVFFISGDMTRYGFTLPASAPTSLPRNNTVIPVGGKLLDSKCQAVAKALNLGT